MSGAQRNTSACMACSGSATLNTKCQTEFGPEWTKVGDTGCGSCHFNGAVIGKHATCQHTSYQGNNLSCCLGNGSGGGNLTCDPNWTLSSGGCDGSMSSYCALNSNAVSDPKCIEWRNARFAQAKATSINTIKANPDLLASADTQLFARQLSNSGDPSLDNAVITFCSKNPNNALCSCINSSADTKLGINPKCVDSKCLETGYLTANQISTACPDVVSCTQINNLKTIGVSLSSNIKASQDCGNNASTAPETPAEPNNTLLYILIFILVIMLGSGIYALFTIDDSEEGVETSEYYTENQV